MSVTCREILTILGLLHSIQLACRVPGWHQRHRPSQPAKAGTSSRIPRSAPLIASELARLHVSMPPQGPSSSSGQLGGPDFVGISEDGQHKTPMACTRPRARGSIHPQARRLPLLSPPPGWRGVYGGDRHYRHTASPTPVGRRDRRPDSRPRRRTLGSRAPAASDP